MSQREERTYRSEDEFEADRQRMWERGWRLVLPEDPGDDPPGWSWAFVGLESSGGCIPVGIAIFVVVLVASALGIRAHRSGLKKPITVQYERGGE